MKKNREIVKDAVFDISPQSEKELRDVFGSDLKKASLEALALIGYRSGKLSLIQVRRLLGFENRWQTENWLNDHGMEWNIPVEDLRTDRNDLYLLFPDNTP